MGREIKTIESSLFDGTCYNGDLNCIEFHDVVLKVPVGEHPIGAKFDVAWVAWEYSVLQLLRGEQKWEYELKLNIGLELPSEVEESEIDKAEQRRYEQWKQSEEREMQLNSGLLGPKEEITPTSSAPNTLAGWDEIINPKS